MPFRLRFVLLVLSFGAAFSSSWASERFVIEPGPNLLAGLRADHDLAFCALDMVTGSMVMLNEEDVDSRHAPWSTFKIPNLIIALESGVAHDLDHQRVWDERRRPAADYWPPAWKQDQTLASAFDRSAAWYFQEVALDVGAERYRSDLLRFGYGNASVPTKSDDFWLGSSLLISPLEQAQFLMQALNGSLALSRQTISALRKVSLLKAAGDHALHGKTGSGRLESDGYEGWLVGWVENEQTPIATFALYMRAPDYRSLDTARLETAKSLLQASGYLPHGWEQP